jgi:fucose 4-O-acetylase-like acetyltransferase
MIWTTVRYFGKSSLFIMGIHVLLLAPIQSMARAITGKPDLLTGLICLALTMLLIYFLIPFTEKYIPWAIGRQRQKQDTKSSQSTEQYE